MKLSHLKIACYLYNQFTNYDSSYLEMTKKYPDLDLSQDLQTKALIEWLRSWGCRQFKKDDENTSLDSLRKWYESIKSKMPGKNDYLIDYDLDKNKRIIVEIFNDLSEREAATRQRGGHITTVSVGPVGTAKTLFALRPNLFCPWDTPIYKEFQLEGDGSGYVRYLLKIQQELKNLRDSLKNCSIKWAELFKYLEKQHNSYPKVIDEYYWITITNKCDPSKIENFCNNQNA